MTDRIKTLLLYTSGFSWKRLVADTTVQGVLGLKSDQDLPPWLRQYPLMRRLAGQRYQGLSYYDDWMEAFCSAPELEVEACNIANLVEYRRCLRKIAQYELIVVLHVAASHSKSLLFKTADWYKRRRGKLLIFIANEYELMPIKIEFIRSVEAEYIGSQLPLDAARWLYAACDRSQILAVPHALNPKIYYPDPDSRRTSDIGFIGDIYPYFIGDTDRTDVIRFFQTHGAALGLTCDIRMERLPRSAWARFLNTCKGTVGAESGTYYLERTDHTINAVRAYVKAHPDATFDEVFERFFRNYPNPVSGKAISSRHFEPIGTKTCQILLEGHYNGILVADEHYIALKKDFSNIQDVVERFKDDAYRDTMVSRTYEYVLAEHTYQHRVSSVLRTVLEDRQVGKGQQAPAAVV